MNGNKENRKAAYMLRKLVDDSDFEVHHDDVFNELGIGTRDGFLYFSDVLVLADLIDRPTCHNILCDEEPPTRDFQCSNCGYVLLFGPGGTEESKLHFCPHCGAEIVKDERR